MKMQDLPQYHLNDQAYWSANRRPAASTRNVLLGLALGLTSLSLHAASVKQVSVDSLGNHGNASSNNPAITPNGRFIVYHSDASNLVEGDTNNATDIFYYDTKKGATYRISSGSQGQANNVSVDPRLSSNGRFVVYSSVASNLVDGDTNAKYDIFLYDTNKGVTRRISVDSLGGAESNGSSFTPSISAKGRYIVYDSDAYNLVPGDANKSRDVFLYDKKTGSTRVVSVDSQGILGNANSFNARISADGRYVVYHSDASNLVAGDTNNATDIFLFDKKTGSTRLVSVNSSSGSQGNGGSFSAHISNNGRYVVYSSDASNLVDGDVNGKSDIFLYDKKTGVTRMISTNSSSGSQGNGDSLGPRVSSQGRYVVYASEASNLVDGDTNGKPDIFRYDTKTGSTVRISVASDGSQATGGDEGGGSFSPNISKNGRFTVYESTAVNLVDGDTNDASDIFLYDIK